MKACSILLILISISVLSVSSNTLENQPGFIIKQTTSYQFAFKMSSAGDVNGDGYSDMIMTGGDYKEGLFLVYGGPNDQLKDLNVNEMTVKQGIKIGTNFYVKTVSSADINKDGYSDLIIGTEYSEKKFSSGPIAYVVFGGPSLSSLDVTKMTATQGFNITNKGINSTGFVSSAGDLNGDGYEDMLIANSHNLPYVAYVVYGGKSLQSFDLGSFTKAQGFEIRCHPNKTSVYIVSSGSAGDVNGDGYPDLLIGSADQSPYAQRNHVIYGGKSLGNIYFPNMTNDQGFNITGDNDYPWTQKSVPAGDFNKDGYADILLTTKFYQKAAVFVVFGRKNNENIRLSEITPLQGIRIDSDRSEWYSFGQGISTAGDFNKDGYSDVVILNSEYSRETDAKIGPAYILYGSANPTAVNVDELASSQGLRIVTSSPFDSFGDVKLVGDVNKDGYSDVMLTIYKKYDDDGSEGYFNSAVQVILGRANS